jgi:hypothetical protein
MAIYSRNGKGPTPVIWGQPGRATTRSTRSPVNKKALRKAKKRQCQAKGKAG